MVTAATDTSAMPATAAASPEAQRPTYPDYMTDPNAVLKDFEAQWRYGRPPDYSKTRKVYATTKKFDHKPGSLQDMVENLVKNWEVEASFKTRLSDWRTVDTESYSFSVNGSTPISGEEMLKVGTYNASIVAPNEWYSPRFSDFASSHKTFKRMMPTFAWEVMEVYSGPPIVAFRWRHWGEMKEDYVGWNDSGDKVVAKAHGGPITLEGLTVAHMNDKLKITKLETWFDPVDMFRKISPHGVVRKDDVAKEQVTAGCPMMGHQRPGDEKMARRSPSSSIEVANEGHVLEVAAADGQAVAGSGASLPQGVTASEVNPANGEIPRANAE